MSQRDACLCQTFTIKRKLNQCYALVRLCSPSSASDPWRHHAWPAATLAWPAAADGAYQDAKQLHRLVPRSRHKFVHDVVHDIVHENCSMCHGVSAFGFYVLVRVQAIDCICEAVVQNATKHLWHGTIQYKLDISQVTIGVWKFICEAYRTPAPKGATLSRNLL